jgi:hypothetical protein
MLLNQPIEIKWNQEMSGNAEDSDGWQTGLGKKRTLDKKPF